jgi:hypothetical protein
MPPEALHIIRRAVPIHTPLARHKPARHQRVLTSRRIPPNRDDMRRLRTAHSSIPWPELMRPRMMPRMHMHRARRRTIHTRPRDRAGPVLPKEVVEEGLARGASRGGRARAHARLVPTTTLPTTVTAVKRRWGPRRTVPAMRGAL